MPSSERPLAANAMQLLLAAVVGAGLWWLSELLVPHAATPFMGHGERFAQMAQDPFAFEGAFPQRLLWPALAYAAGWFGISAVAFSQVCSAALLATVFWFARRRCGNTVDALLAAAAIAVSGAVLVYKPMTCFSDSLNLLVMVLLVHFARRPAVFWPLVLLSAFSHEMVFFFWPWLLYLRCNNGGSWRRELIWLGAAIGLYGLFRAPMQGPYDANYYIENSIWVPWALPFMWAVWAFLVLVEFGPLLLSLGWAQCSGALARPDALGGRWGIYLYIAGVMPLMLLAYDVMRFAAFALLPVLLSLCAMLRAKNGRVVVGALVIASVASYRWLHPVPSQQGGAHFTEMSGHMNARLMLLVDRSFGKAWQFSTEVVGASWWMWTFAVVAVVVLVVASRLLARRIAATGDSVQ